MRTTRIAILTLTLLAASAARGADLSLELLARPPAAAGLLLRAHLTPDRPDLKHADFALTIRPADGKDATDRPLPFLSARFRNAYYLDVRELPPLPRARYRITLTLGPDTAGVRTAALEDTLEFLPPDIDVALVIDQSFSMRRTDPDRLRVAAAKTFVDLAASGNRIRNIAVVAFDARNETLVTLAPPSETRRLHEAIDRIATLGQTNIDGALDRARAELDAGTSRGKAALLLTDGENQPDPYKNAHRAFARLGWPVYAVGLSKEADAETLKRIASETGGAFFDAPASDQLREIFSRICFALERHVPVRKTTLALKAGESARDPVPIDDTVSAASFTARGGRADFVFAVSPPPGKSAAPAQTSTAGSFKFFTFQKPCAGLWTATARAGAENSALTLETTAVTALFPLVLPLAPEYKFGEPVDVACTLADGSRPVAGARLVAALRTADGKTHTATLEDLGGGVYAASFTQRLEPGDFTLAASASGATALGNAFERRVEATGRIARPLEPEIWAERPALDLEPLYNGETARATMHLRRILPPFAAFDLTARCSAERLPADSFALELAPPDSDGSQTLRLSFTPPLDLPGGKYAATLTLALGPKVTRELPVRIEVVNPRIAVEPVAVQFGPMLAGTSAARQVTLRAEPRGQLNATLALLGAPAHFTSLDTRAARLTARPMVVALAAAPPRGSPAGTSAGSLEINTAFETRSVPVTVVVSRVGLSAEPDAVDFGSVEPGQTVARRIRLRATGPVAVDAAVAVECADLAPGALRPGVNTLRLDPARPVELDLALAIPYPHRLGDFAGRIRFRSDDEIGSVPVRGRVVAAPTFALEADSLDLGTLDIGRRASASLAVRSLIDADQLIRIESRSGPGFISAEAATISLPARAAASLRITCLPPLDAQSGGVRRELALVGPMLPRSLALTGVVVPPRGGSFTLASDRVTLPDGRPGTELSASVAVTSTLDLPQVLALAALPAVDQSVWLHAPAQPVLAGPRATVELPFRCSISPGAAEGTYHSRLSVRGPFHEQPVSVHVRTFGGTAASAPSGRYFLVLLLLLGILVTAALGFLIIRALLQIHGHHMVKYFAASAVLNVGFFLIITQIVAVRQVMRESEVVVRIEAPGALGSAEPVEPAAAAKPLATTESDRRAESERAKTQSVDPAKDPARAEQERLEALRREQERLRTELENRIDEPRPELAKLSTRELEEVIDAADKMARKLKAESASPAEPAHVEDGRVVGESEGQKRFEAAAELARTARDLIARRGKTGESATAPVEAASARIARLSTAIVETLADEIRAAPRRTESAPAAETGPSAAGGPRFTTPTAEPRPSPEAATESGTIEPAAAPLTTPGPGRLAPPDREPVVSAPTAAPDRIPAAPEPAELAAVPARPAERLRGAGPQAPTAAMLQGDPRHGVPAPLDSRGELLAAVAPAPRPRETAAARTASPDLPPVPAPESTPAASDRPAALPRESVSVEPAAPPRRVEASAPTEPAFPPPGPVEHVSAPTGAAPPAAARVAVQDAAPVAAVTVNPRPNLDGRVNRGEVLVAGAVSAAGIARAAPAAAPEPLDVDTPARAARPAAVPRAETDSYAAAVSAERRPRAEPALSPAPYQAAPVRIQPVRAGSALPVREPLGVVVAQPERTSVARTSMLALVGRRTAGTIPFALARYSGDWDCDATAMPNLAYQLERRVGITLSTETRTLDLTDPGLLKQPFIFISGHKDFRFSDAELAALRKYLLAGGSLWINDSTDELDTTFDRAARRELKRLLPDGEVARLPKDHPVFSSGYDLTRGFRGYAVPPGDKYRCDYLEGVNLAGRTAVFYTRNDYGDGLEIDPNTAPLMPSLTDLSPHDMQEGSVRMGINIVLYFLQGRPAAANTEAVADAVRSHAARSELEERSAIDGAEILVLDNFDGEFSWNIEPDWGDAAEVAPATPYPDKKNIALSARFALGDKKKIAASRDLLEDKDLSKYNAIVLDLTSRLTSGCRVAVGVVTMPDWKYFESPPAYVRPGANPNLIFRLDRPNFKSAESEWKYSQAVANLSAVRKIVLLIYPISPGSVELDNVRAAKLKPPTATPK